MDLDQDVIEFIRESLRANERIRDKGSPQFSQQAVVSKTTTSFDTTLDPIPPPPTTSGNVLGGGDGNHPFKITTQSAVYNNESILFFKVSYNSSIINGTNGGPFIISNLNEDILFEREGTEPKFIIAEATVTSNPFEIKTQPAEGEPPPPQGQEGAFTIKAVGEDETDEVLIEDGKQTKLRLLIGKLTVQLTDNGYKLTAWQAVKTSFKTAVSLHNGVPVYILQPAPTHQSRI